jgi:ABC-type transport system substrate-binding protein
VSGSGPYVFQGFDENRRLRFEATPGDARARLQRLSVAGPGQGIRPFASFEVDEFIARDRRDAAAVRNEVPGTVELRMWEESPVISTMAVDAAPWNDPRLRTALSAALNRAELVDRLFGGRALPSGPVPPAHEGFALDEQALASYPGYRDLETDVREARAAWLAAGGDSLGEVSIDFPAPFDPRYSASSVVTGMLTEALGGSFVPRVDSYVNISRKTLDGYYGNGRSAFWFGWGPALTSPDPSMNLFETYHSGSATAVSHGYNNEAVDASLERLRSTRDVGERASLAGEIQRALLSDAAGGVLPWALQQSEHFVHGYVQGRRLSPFPAESDVLGLRVDTGHERYPARD